jgi:hypothetical protein
MPEPVEVRAERLRLFVALIGEEPTMRAGEGQLYGFVPGGWSYYMDDAAPQDYPDEFDLAWTCADVAHAVREHQWRSLEAFCAACAAGEEVAAAVAAFDLGWHHQLPEEG